jgi:hypothetical protein
MASNVHRQRFSYDTAFDRIEEIDCKGTFIEDSSDIIQNITEYLKENGLVCTQTKNNAVFSLLLNLLFSTFILG